MDSTQRRTQVLAGHLAVIPNNNESLSSVNCAEGKDDLKDFLEIYPTLISEIIAELPSTYEMPPHAVSWMQKLIDYTVPGGKMNRGLTVIHSLQSLVENRKLTRNEVFNAYVLGWCIEWLQAFFLVSDDVMDQSVTRRGLPCWYRANNPLHADAKVGLIAINDAFLLEACIYRLLKKFFSSEPYYVALLDLFHDVTYQTELGQLLDLTTQPAGTKVDISKFTLETYKRIVKYKTAFYSFYLPVALAMLMAGIVSEPAFETAKKILLPIGEYFQIQDDYLDCYGSPAVIGKVGRDIEENKCSWLVVQALLHANPEQRALLEQHYGRDHPEHVAIVKKVYEDINIIKVFKDYEEESYKSLVKAIKGCIQLPQEVFLKLLAKIYKREL